MAGKVLPPLTYVLLHCDFASLPIKMWSLCLYPLNLGLILWLVLANGTSAQTIQVKAEGICSLGLALFGLQLELWTITGSQWRYIAITDSQPQPPDTWVRPSWTTQPQSYLPHSLSNLVIAGESSRTNQLNPAWIVPLQKQDKLVCCFKPPNFRMASYTVNETPSRYWLIKK